MKRLAIVLTILILSGTAFAAHRFTERVYQIEWCTEHGGIIEYVLPDKTRVDCLTDEYAVEVDFGPKWAEGVGQALYYAARTGKKPGIVLILEKPSDRRHVLKLNILAEKYGIKIWVIEGWR